MESPSPFSKLSKLSMTTSNNSQSSASHAPQLDVHHILQNVPPQSPRQASCSSAGSNAASMKEKQDSVSRRQNAYSSSSRTTEASSSNRTETRSSNLAPRSLPPWIDNYEEGSDPTRRKSMPTDRLIPPSPAHSASHHHTPSSPNRRISQDGYVDDYDDLASGLKAKKPETGLFGGIRQPVRGRKWDHARDGEPVILQAGVAPTGTQWTTYIKSSMYGPGTTEDPKLVDEEFLRQQTPGYERPWRGDLPNRDDPEKNGNIFRSRKKRQTFVTRLQRNLLVSPYVPFVLRSIVIVTSVFALGFSTSIHHLSNNYRYGQNPSTTMAIIVDVVAIPYISYITYDEYRGKPLGLRPARTKIRLVLLDLFFIVFESANLALAFGALTDNNGACTTTDENPRNGEICGRVKTLCAILFVALVAWSATFAISIFRLVERIGGREDAEH